MKTKLIIIFSLFTIIVQCAKIPPIPNIQQYNEQYRERSVRNAVKIVGADKSVEEDALLTTPQLIEKYGYPSEKHSVTTEDGYILEVHRIPHGKNSQRSDKGVVFLQHGIFCSSADWIIAGPGKGLGYILADLGYDVWLGNARGNRYSRRHTYLNPDRDSDFWEFSWHQIGYFDLPAMINYALEVSGEEKLFYVGHSQGTTSFFVMTSERPEYNDKIRAQFSLAPIAYMKRMTSPVVQFIANFVDIIDTIADLIGMNEFIPSSKFLATVGAGFCGDDDITSLLCTNVLFVTCGYNKKELNTTLLPIIMGHAPAGIATDQLVHYGQEVHALTNHFRKWDYGFFGNLKHYGSATPPNYKLGKVTAPVYLLYSHNDWLAAESDVIKLYNELGNAQGKFLMVDDKWNHLDYTYGINANTVVYNKIISLMNRH